MMAEDADVAIPAWVAQWGQRLIIPALTAGLVTITAWISGIPSMSSDITYIRGSVERLSAIVDSARMDVVRHEARMNAMEASIAECKGDIRREHQERSGKP